MTCAFKDTDYGVAASARTSSQYRRAAGAGEIVKLAMPGDKPYRVT